MKPLKSVRDVIGVAEVKIRRIENGADHGQISFIFILLALAEMKLRWNVGNDVHSCQAPDDLTVDETDSYAMCRNDQMLSRC